MSIKTYKINSNLAEYTDEEFSALENFVCTEGVFDVNGDDTDLQVTESTPNAMTVDVATGAALVTFLKNSVTWKVVARSNAVEAPSISANATGNDRVDAIVVHLKQDEPNALKNNVGEIRVILGSGVSALSDSAIDSSLADTNWYRLADVTVPNGASSITNSDITDTRARITLDALPTDGGSTYVTTVGNQTISGIKTFQTNFPTVASGVHPPTTDYQLTTKKYVDDAVAEAGEVIVNDYIYGDTIAARDVLYHDRSDNKVKRITSDPDTWRTIVGVALDAGVDTDTSKRILIKGLVTGASFSAVNPTFSASGGAVSFNVNSATHSLGYAYKLDNAAGAEGLINGTCTISLKHSGVTPSANLKVSICLGESDRPHLTKTSTYATIGAIIDTQEINRLAVSGVYANHSVTFSNIILPANAELWLVFTSDSVSGNHYDIEGTASGTDGAKLATNTQRYWTTGDAFLPNYTLTMESVNPWDKRYDIRAFGNGVTGGAGIGDNASANMWGRVIGHVVSATSWYLNLDSGNTDSNNIAQSAVYNSSWPLNNVTTGFRPSWLDFGLNVLVATASTKVGPGYANYISDATTARSIQGSYLLEAGGALGAVGSGIWGLGGQYYCIPHENGFYIWPQMSNSQTVSPSPWSSTNTISSQSTYNASQK